MDLLLTVVLTIFIFGLLVFIHELGHFLAAIKNGVYVEEFAFGFGPKVFSKKWKNVDYRINLIPLGGYVKMLGDMDGSSFMRHSSEEVDKKSLEFVKTTLKKEGLDGPDADYARVVKFIDENSTKFSEKEVQAFQDYLAYDFIPNHPQNFDNKSFLQRLVILTAGVFMNFMLGAFLFYILFLFTNFTADLTKIGNPIFIGAQTSNPPVIFQVYNDEYKEAAGSIIHSINGETIIGEEQFFQKLDENYNTPVNLTIENINGKSDFQMVLSGEGINTNFDNEVINKVVLIDILENSAAEKAGIEGGSIILSMSDVAIETPDQLRKLLDEKRGTTVPASIIDLEGKLKEITLDLPDSAVGEPVLGAIPVENSPFFSSVLRVSYLQNKLASGGLHATNLIIYNATALASFVSQAFAERSVEPVFSQVNSIVAVVDVTFSLVKANNFLSILNLVALLSVVLAFMNILPIPLFDGGHVLFLFIEKLRGKKISTETQNKVGKIVFFVLIALTIAIMFKDVRQFEWLQRIAGFIGV